MLTRQGRRGEGDELATTDPANLQMDQQGEFQQAEKTGGDRLN
jgi:hypothetical protein